MAHPFDILISELIQVVLWKDDPKNFHYQGSNPPTEISYYMTGRDANNPMRDDNRYLRYLTGLKIEIIIEIREFLSNTKDIVLIIGYLNDHISELENIKKHFNFSEIDNISIYNRLDIGRKLFLAGKFIWITPTEAEKRLTTIKFSPFFKHQYNIISQLIDYLDTKLKVYSLKVEVIQPPESTIKQNTIKDLHINHKMKASEEKISKLDIRQTALLFHYLKRYGLVRNLSNKSLAELVHHLTGYSEQNLRTSEGFSQITNIIVDKVKDQEYKNVPSYNLKSVRTALEEILEEINAEISKNSSNQ